MTSPCLGPEFTLDAGNRIQLELCGSPTDQDWPFDCTPRINNGLHRNEDGCLWVAPYGSAFALVQEGSASCAFFCTYSDSAAVYGTSIVSMTVTNTDTCRAKDFIVHTDYKFLVTPANNVGTVTQFWRQVTGVDGADAGWQLVYSIDSGLNPQVRAFSQDAWTIKGLAPGASKTVRVGMRVNASVGSGSANTFDARIGVFGVPSD